MKDTATDHDIGFGTALRRYVGVMVALLRREEELRRAAPLEAMLSVLEPVLLITVSTISFELMLKFRGAGPLGGSPVLFYATGFFANYFFIYLSRRMGRSVDAPGRRFPLEQTLDLMIVHIILNMIDYTLLGILLFGGIYFVSTEQALPYNIVPIFEASAAIMMLGFGVGVVNLVMSRIFKLWKFLFPPVMRFSMIFSGMFYVLDMLPPSSRYVLSFNPMAHAVILFRRGFYPNQPTLVLDTHYLFECAFAAVFLGLIIERLARRGEG